MNIDTATFNKGIKKLCELAAAFEARHHYYPTLVTNAKIVQGLDLFKQALKSEVKHDLLQYQPVIDAYSRDASMRYINQLVPEGIVIFKLAQDAEIHRIYDYPRGEEENQEVEDAVGTVFKGLRFDSNL